MGGPATLTLSIRHWFHLNLKRQTKVCANNFFSVLMVWLHDCLMKDAPNVGSIRTWSAGCKKDKILDLAQ